VHLAEQIKGRKKVVLSEMKNASETKMFVGLVKVIRGEFSTISKIFLERMRKLLDFLLKPHQPSLEMS
jgi:hypothetical protein